MMGLTAALHLAQAQRSVTLVEAGPELGGLAGSCSLGDIHWDRFYHVILSSDENLRGLLSSLNLDEKIRFRRTSTGLHIGGRIQSVSTPAELLACRDIPWSAKLGLGRAVLASMAETSIHNLDAETAVDWLTRHSGKKAVDIIWRPLLRAKLGNSADDASALFIWSTLRRLYGVGAGRFGSGQFGYVAGGYRSIISALEIRLVQLGVNIIRDWPLANMECVGQQHVLTSPGQAAIVADRVVLTIPGPRVARACPSLTATEKNCLADTGFLGVICVSLLLDRPLTGFYISNLTDEDAPFTGIIEMTNLVDPEVFGGRHLVYLPLYLRSDDPRFGLDDRAISGTFTAYLAKLIPGFSTDSILATGVNRAAQVLAVPDLGRIDRIPKLRSTVPGVYLLNGAQIIGGTLNVNETLRHAEESIASLFVDEPGSETRFPAVELWARLPPWDDRLAQLENDLLMSDLKHHQLLPGSQDRVLDLGCGPGITAERLMDHVREYAGLDVSIAALAHARQRIGAAENVTFLPLDRNLPGSLDVVKGRKFTYILCNSVIQYLPDMASIQLLFRALQGVAAASARVVIGDIPVRHRFIREAMLALALGTRAGFPLQTLSGLFMRMLIQHAHASRAERPTIHDLTALTRAAEEAGFGVEVLPVLTRPSGNRVLLVCHGAPGSASA
jgi:protoporphyrinogen oxidase/SAM-dependent methyltransferase